MITSRLSVEGKKYDYIILGAGCAGLSLLMRLLQSGKFNDKNILLIDRVPKNTNDRTWCYWEKENGFFDSIVYMQWEELLFQSETFTSTLHIAPYVYKMIRGIDFYQYCFAEIERHSNVAVIYGEISLMADGKLLLDNEPIDTGDAIIFNSIYNPEPINKKTIRLLQHFKGWLIKTEDPVFDPSKASFMDFRVHQRNGTGFAYVLPFSTTHALVEYTLFSKSLLAPAEYDSELKDYIEQNLGCKNYTVKETEFGVIPMTNEKFKIYKGHVLHIGTAGGQTKASSGYTFQFIQKQSQQIVDALVSGKPLSSVRATPARFRFYDHTLLYLLYHDKVRGNEIFSTLFKKNKPQRVLRFLDNESSLGEEIGIISSLPVWPFLIAAFRH
jgi:lycopene beta-cyclase